MKNKKENYFSLLNFDEAQSFSNMLVIIVSKC